MSRPAARIRANGTEITTRLIGEKKPLISLTITDNDGQEADSLDLELDNRDRHLAPNVGDVLEVWLGYEPQPAFMGKFRVDSWTEKGPRSTLTISAQAAELTTKIKETKTRSWHEMSIGSIVSQIAGEHGLGSVVDGSLASREIEHIDQQSESDVGFLTRLAARNGANFKVTEGKILFSVAGGETGPSGKAAVAIKVAPRDVSDWSITQNERGEHKSVICYYEDKDRARRVGVKSGSGRPVHRVRKTYATKAEAQAAADSKLGSLTRGTREGSFSGVGNPDIVAGCKIALAGFSTNCDGGYFVRTVRHNFSVSGYTMDVDFQTEKSKPDD